eukprot:2277097-Rhodomonas_salina.1
MRSSRLSSSNRFSICEPYASSVPHLVHSCAGHTRAQYHTPHGSVPHSSVPARRIGHTARTTSVAHTGSPIHCVSTALGVGSTDLQHFGGGQVELI